ncbi:MAG TPA: hypothetical protein VF791_22290 [Pyrinomonadaceae bacterium]
MKMISKVAKIDRRGERGAALISTLLLAVLLLSAGGALVLTTTMSATNAIDSTAEMQAYYGAEAGLQSTINTLRGNVWSSNATPAASFRAAVEPDESNLDGDPATDQNVARLSRWLTYNANNRVVVPGTDNFIAYDVTARDLDDSKTVRYATAGSFDPGTSGCTASGSTLTCNGSGVNQFVLRYVPQPATALLAYPAISSPLGSFVLTKTASGASIPAGTVVRFRLTIDQTLPWAARDSFMATVSGEVTAVSSDLKISFSGPSVKVGGTSFALCAGCNPLSINSQLVLGGLTSLSATVTAPQPRRILVQATGYGPKGAIKKLEMVLNNGLFDFDAPATLTMRGSDNCNAMTFDTGSSGSKIYSGMDNASTEAQLPAFAVSGCDVATANSGVKKPETVEDPEIAYLDNSSLPAGTTVSTVEVPTPDFLETAEEARKTLNELQETAEGSGRYFSAPPGGAYTVSTANTKPDMLTFVDGDCELEGGSGLLVVTGNLSMSGNPSFNGVILVMGAGTVNRDGGGNGNVYGALVVASFNRHGNGGFSAPVFNTNGGGNSTMQYDSLAVTRALSALGVSVGGVREY